MKQIDVLDHGYVRFVEAWGRGDAGVPEAAIVEAARQSTQGSFRGWAQDAKLLRYLYTAKPPHATPFEFAGMTIEVQAPIFVFREWMRHRTQSYNEMSARYAPLPDVHYIPSIERIMQVGGANKQAGAVKDALAITVESAERFRVEVEAAYEHANDLYLEAMRNGVPKELARVVMPVGRYSRMRASANLRNWLAFMTLRADPGAQWEIQQFAEAVSVVIAAQFPQTWALFQEVRNG